MITVYVTLQTQHQWPSRWSVEAGLLKEARLLLSLGGTEVGLQGLASSEPTSYSSEPPDFHFIGSLWSSTAYLIPQCLSRGSVSLGVYPVLSPLFATEAGWGGGSLDVIRWLPWPP